MLQDRWSSPCISFSDFTKLHEHPKTLELALYAARNDAKQRIEDDLSGANERFSEEIRQKLEEYREYLRLLEEIHLKYLLRINPLKNKTPLAAAYLLFARIINLLRMGCVCLEASYWNTGAVIRQIDEAIQVAEYFSSESTPALKRDVTRWFQENRSPNPSEMRKADAARVGVDLGSEKAERHLYLINDLYDLKSKWIHPTFSPIRETLQIQLQDGEAVVTGFDYGPSTYPRKLHELTLFYRSSIWTAVQGFVMCFQQQIPLDDIDSDRLHALNRKFTEEPDGL
ncbi:MAG TPA: hypothetical protein VIE69_03185 [Methylophilaceae bacterium]